jgi:sugar O-acyltransferase (sialic acid O-acetyltransferase NeuD family)
MKLHQLILIGSGDFALEVSEYIVEKNKDLSKDNFIISDIISKSEARFYDICSVLGYTPLHHGKHNTIKQKEKKNTLICLGSAEARYKYYNELKKNKFSFGTFIHKTAWVASSSKINEGVIVCPYVFVGANSVIGPNTSLNVRATIGHDVKIGESVVISPHVNLNGNSQCGDVSFIGAGTIMDPESSVGNFTKVSSGSMVKGSFGNGFLLSGNPAKGRQMFKTEDKI